MPTPKNNIVMKFFFILLILFFSHLSSAQANVNSDINEQSPEYCQNMANYDPWEGFNRQVFAFNLWIDDYLISPLAQGYDFIRPDFLKKPLNNFYNNLHEPLNTLHNLLQGDMKRTGDSWTRFFINSTFGLLGFFDIAESENVHEAPEDLGQTLAVWGVGDGAYLVVPFLGPSTLRDGFGQLGDKIALNPWYYVADNNDALGLYYGLTAGELLELRADNLDKIRNLRNSAADDESFYAMTRSLYCQKRQSAISNGNIDNSGSFENDFFQTDKQQ